MIPMTQKRGELFFRRIADESGLTEVRRLAGGIWPRAFADILSGEQIRYMMDMMYAPEVMRREYGNGIVFDLLYENGVPSGYAVCEKLRNVPEVMKLHKLYLDFRLHGLGIGQFMLWHVFAAARSAGCSFVRLNVNRNNRRAVLAYLRSGFYVSAAVAAPIGGGFVMDDFIMDRALC